MATNRLFVTITAAEAGTLLAASLPAALRKRVRSVAEGGELLCYGAAQHAAVIDALATARRMGVNAWADGFGVWHVRVPKSDIGTVAAARLALRAELEPREANLDPAVWRNPERVPDLDTPTTIVYREGTPS